MRNTLKIDEDSLKDQSAMEVEPRWPAALALLAVGSLNTALPVDLAIIPQWYLLLLIVALLIPTLIAHRKSRHHLNQMLGYIVSGVITIALIGSLALLIRA